LKIFYIFLLILNFISLDTTVQNNELFFYDSFENLDKWKPFQFSSNKKPTDYKIISEENKNCLQIKSDSSASGLICKSKFNPTQYPLLNWKWKVSNIIPNAKGKTKDGDDYPVRIFAMFEKNSSQISIWDKLQKGAIKLFSGYDPPYKSLCYVWTNSETDSSNYCSPYTDDVMIVCKQSGSKKCNQWIEEKVNIVADYKEYFNEDVPSIACIAIMGDSDNTAGKSIAYLGKIEIKAEN